MTYDEDEQDWVLSSGRRFYAFSETIGIEPDSGGMFQFGSDGGVDTSDWTPEERAEVADEMIRRWTVFKERHALAPR